MPPTTSIRTRALAALAACAMCAAAASAQLLVTPKHRAAPAEDIISGRLRAPDPAANALQSQTAVIELNFVRDPSGAWRATADIPAPTTRTARMMILSPDADDFQLTLTPEAHAPIRLDTTVRHANFTTARGPIHLGDYATIGDLYLLQDLPAGAMTLDVVMPADMRAEARPRASAIIRYDNADPLRTHLTHHNLIVANRAAYRAAPPDGRVTSATLTLDEPNGASRTIQFTRAKSPEAAFIIRNPGLHKVRIDVSGVDPQGRPYLRTAHHIFRAASPAFDLADHASADGDNALDIRIALDRVFRSDRCIASAELWAAAEPDAEPQPIAWIGGMTAPIFDEAAANLPLTIDPRWITGAGAAERFSLRNVRIICPQTMAVLAEKDSIALTIEPGALAQARTMPAAPPATSLAPACGMQFELPAQYAALASARATGAHNLLLSHGYCAGGNPWPLADFTGALEVFNDPEQNRSQDAFALLLLALGNNGKSFGVVAHSQGGLAALHLYTFYYSGLDWAEGNRLIQSVGSPYQGTPLAGSLAGIGDIFGTGCGENADLDPDGAAVWLSTIPTAARSAVHYWTTSTNSSACNFFSGLFLTDPEDGVVEMHRAQLPGANSMGHTTGWCHTTGMSNPAQYTDAARNAEMNTNAAR